MQDIVGTAITSEEQRLITIIQNYLSETDKQHLKNYYIILLDYMRSLE